MNTFSDLPVNFSRTGACYAQDGGTANAIWIYGGMAQGPNNAAPFLQFNFVDNSFKALPAPPAAYATQGVSCAITTDGKFYVLFGDTTSDGDFQDDLDNCTFAVSMYTTATNWTQPATNGTVKGRVGSFAFVYAGSIVVFGGKCGSEYYDDVSRLDLATMKWSTDGNISGVVPDGRAFVSAFVQQSILYVFGGMTSTGTANDAYAYDLGTHNWTMISAASVPDARYLASTVGLNNRGLILGGQNENNYLEDLVQLVLENQCMSKGCEDCTTTDGCGWCGSSSRCVAGSTTAAFVSSTCNATSNYINDLDSCPQVFPSYGIALLVIGGVVVVGIIIFAIMKVRSGGDDKEGYERIS